MSWMEKPKPRPWYKQLWRKIRPYRVQFTTVTTPKFAQNTNEGAGGTYRHQGDPGQQRC